MKALNEKKIKLKIKEALRTGRWFLRRSYFEKSYKGFQWNGIGEWTVAPDWNPEPICGGGLHGNGPDTSPGKCYWNNGPTLEFCTYEGKPTYIGGEEGKIKVQKAMILMVNELPKGISVGGYLNLEGTNISELPKGLSVGGSLYLEGTNISELPKGLSVSGSLYLQGTKITTLPEGLSVDGYLDLEGTNISELPKGLSVSGNIYQ